VSAARHGSDAGARVLAAHPGGATTAEAPATPGFINDVMRPYAMKLHTRAQAPKEGQAPAKEDSKPMREWSPSVKGYLQFLVDSRALYQALEDAVATHAALHALQATGLERVAALDQDIAWVAAGAGGLSDAAEVPAVGAAGLEYSALLTELAATDQPRFLNHFYNHYFAHTAGGRMIGKKVSAAVLGGADLAFYQWAGHGGEKPQPLLDGCREKIDALAAQWSAEEKAVCLEETGAAFKYGGMLMQAIAS